MRRFTDEPLLVILEHLNARCVDGRERVTIEVLDPDLGVGRYAGERVEHEGRPHVHRPFRLWVDLAERLGLRLFTPRVHTPGFIALTFEALDPTQRWQGTAVPEVSEKYGMDSGYQRISKLEDPGLIVDLADALERAELGDDARVLDLGINTGDEFTLLSALSEPLRRSGSFVGVDHSATAIARARERFDPSRHEFIEADLGALSGLELGRFDLVLSLGTLQSPGVDDREVLRDIVQHRLPRAGTVILGIPNCRYLDGEVEYGARMKNFRQPDLSLLIKGVAFYRKYLQQHRFRVFVTGKHYVLVTGVRR
ncbi:MAG: class I SAM-dependent methyltransferase [Myxococcota bacterium]